MSEFPFSLRVEFFMTIIMHSAVIAVEEKRRKTLLVSECACMHEKSESQNTNAQKKASKMKLL
jgi:hypothetical protein